MTSPAKNLKVSNFKPELEFSYLDGLSRFLAQSASELWWCKVRI